MGGGKTWAALPLNYLPEGTTTFSSSYEWTTLTKNQVIYDDGNYIMMWSNGNNLAIDDSNGLKIGNSSKKSAFVFRVENTSNISVAVGRNGQNITVGLYYLGTSTTTLTDPNSMSPTGALSTKTFTNEDITGTLTQTNGDAGYYMVFGEKAFCAKSISITPAAPSTKTTVNAAASNQTSYFDNSGTISTDTKTLSLTGVPVTIVGTQKFEAGSNNYKFTISENDYTAIKVSKTGTYVITPGAGVTVNSVNVYATSNSSTASQISTYDGTSQSLAARGASGTPASPTAFPLSKNASGNYEFTIGGSASQAIVVVVVNYDTPESVDVTVSSAGYATLYYDKNLTVPTGVTAYKAAISGSNIELTDIGDLIPANTGVILKADAGKYNFITTTADASAVDVSGNILEGTTSATTKAALGGKVFTLGQDALGVVGLRNYTGTDIRAYCAYSTNDGLSALGRAFYPFDEDGDVTGISTIPAPSFQKDDIYYDLNGRRVLYPTKGLYIVNGKKVVIK